MKAIGVSLLGQVLSGGMGQWCCSRLDDCVEGLGFPATGELTAISATAGDGMVTSAVVAVSVMVASVMVTHMVDVSS